MDSVINLFLKAWRQEDYIQGEELPNWVELPKEDFVEILQGLLFYLPPQIASPQRTP